MTLGLFETTNTGSSASANNQGQNAATSTSDAFSFGTPKPTTAFEGFSFTTPNTRSASSDAGSLFGEPKVQTFGVTPPTNANPDPPPVAMGTSAPTYSVFSEKDPSNPSAVLQYQTISATPAYRGTSLEELRVQDYEQNRGPRSAESTHGSSPGSPAIRATSLSETATVKPQPANDPTIGAAASTGTGSTLSVSTRVSAFGKLPQEPSASTFRALVPAPGPGTTLDQPVMLDPKKPECIEELLKKLFLGEELVDIRFHLFSAKSSTSRRVIKPRVLCANSAILIKRSKYFLDLMTGDDCSSDPSLVDITSDDDVPSCSLFADYGYGSDSDLEDLDVPLHTSPEVPMDWSLSNDYEESSDDGSESVSSDMFFSSSEQLTEDNSFTVDNVENGLVTTGKTRVRETVHNDELGNQSTTHRRSFKRGRDVLIKDTAFRTWYTLLNYVHAGKLSFLPLTSTAPSRECGHSGSCMEVPSCSAKSMYRLASKVGLDHVRDEACSYILSNLDEHNILKELSCSLVSKHPRLRELELDVLYSHIASPPVVSNFAAFAQHIAQKPPHGADIIVGIHTRLLKAHHPFALRLEAPPPAPTPPPLSLGLSDSGPPEGADSNVHVSDAPERDAKEDAGLSHLVQPSTRSDALPSHSAWSTSARRPPAGGKRGSKHKK